MSQFGGPLQQDPHRKANCILIASKQILFLGGKLHKICVGWCLDHSIIDSYMWYQNIHIHYGKPACLLLASHSLFYFSWCHS